MHVIGTAGHVDHGKSTLVEALTGIDPDRLREEKERGLTVDLGFAWLSLPSGKEISIVDVPGHERFVSNMLAGIGGIDLAMLVVAADESVMAQTKEHLAILDLLQINHGLVAVTKKDLVDDDWLDLVITEIKDLLKNTVLKNAQVVPVSGTTGEGLPDLISTVDDLLETTEPRKDLGRPRLPIDRSFTMPGFGTVVTGTLIDGSLNVGQEIELVLAGKTTRVRNLQTHLHKLDHASPGNRVAANLTGVANQTIDRGEILTNPGWLRPTTAVDVEMKIVRDCPQPVKHNMFVILHTGSSERLVRIRLLESEIAEPGKSTWAQFKLNDPVAVVKGDYFVIRSNRNTLGGGTIVDPHARRHRRMHLPTLGRLAIMKHGSNREILLNNIQMSEPTEFQLLVNMANVEPAVARSELKKMTDEKLVILLGRKTIGPGIFIYSAAGWELLAKKTHEFLKRYHNQHPLRIGPPKEELRSRLNLTPQVFNTALSRLEENEIIRDKGPLVQLPDHIRKLSKLQQSAADEYLHLLEASPYSPPTNSTIDEEVLHLLADEGRVVQVNETIVFSDSAYQTMAKKISEYIEDQGEVSIANVRDMFGTSRKYALALLDHLDKQHITRRVGDSRILR